MKKYEVTVQGPNKHTWTLKDIDEVQAGDVKESGTILKRNGTITAIVPKDWLIVLRDN